MVTAVTGSCTLHKNPISSTQHKDQQVSCDTLTSNLTNRLERFNLDSGTREDATGAMLCDNDDLYLSNNGNLVSGCQQNYSMKNLGDTESKDQSEGSQQQTYHTKTSKEHGSGICLQSELQPNQRDSQTVFYYISPEETRLTIHAHGAHQRERSISRGTVTYESIGGLQKQVALVREMIELPLKHPEMFTNYGM